jgi:acyl carrier protein
VRQAAVVAAGGDDGADAQRLVAYLLVESGRSPEAGELRRHLRERLPAHMLPAAYVMLDELPLTPSGKVDRRALPVLAPAGRSPDAAWVAPRTATENKIAAIWQSVLGLERVDIHTNFFELGGHSLGMVEVYRRLAASPGDRLGLTDLFDHPTVSALAKFLDRRTAHEAAPPVDGAAGRRRRALARQRELALRGREKR